MLALSQTVTLTEDRITISRFRLTCTVKGPHFEETQTHLFLNRKLLE